MKGISQFVKLPILIVGNVIIKIDDHVDNNNYFNNDNYERKIRTKLDQLKYYINNAGHADSAQNPSLFPSVPARPEIFTDFSKS